MNTIEIENKYLVTSKDKVRLVEFCNEIMKGEPNELSLIDYRFNIFENSHGGKDFERLRISTNNKTLEQVFIWTKKYTDDTGVRREEEKTVNKSECENLVGETSGKIVFKTRLDWHGELKLDSLMIQNFSIAIDKLDGGNELFWELEVLSGNEKIENIYNLIFERIVEDSQIDAKIETRSMLEMSEDLECKDLDSLLKN